MTDAHMLGAWIRTLLTLAAIVWVAVTMVYSHFRRASILALLQRIREQTADYAASRFEVEQRCPECGERMLPAVSLWRCSAHPGEHQTVGPGVAYEIRECSAVVAQAPKPLRPLADDTTEARGDGRS